MYIPFFLNYLSHSGLSGKLQVLRADSDYSAAAASANAALGGRGVASVNAGARKATET